MLEDISSAWGTLICVSCLACDVCLCFVFYCSVLTMPARCFFLTPLAKTAGNGGYDDIANGWTCEGGRHSKVANRAYRLDR